MAAVQSSRNGRNGSQTEPKVTTNTFTQSGTLSFEPWGRWAVFASDEISGDKLRISSGIIRFSDFLPIRPNVLQRLLENCPIPVIIRFTEKPINKNTANSGSQSSKKNTNQTSRRSRPKQDKFASAEITEIPPVNPEFIGPDNAVVILAGVIQEVRKENSGFLVILKDRLLTFNVATDDYPVAVQPTFSKSRNEFESKVEVIGDHVRLALPGDRVVLLCKVINGSLVLSDNMIVESRSKHDCHAANQLLKVQADGVENILEGIPTTESAHQLRRAMEYVGYIHTPESYRFITETTSKILDLVKKNAPRAFVDRPSADNIDTAEALIHLIDICQNSLCSILATSDKNPFLHSKSTPSNGEIEKKALETYLRFALSHPFDSAKPSDVSANEDTEALPNEAERIRHELVEALRCLSRIINIIEITNPSEP